MFCPVCLYEYNQGVNQCPDCGEKLVEKIPEEEQGDANLETAELCEVETELDAARLTAMLADQGIYSFIRSNVLPSSGLVLFAFKHRKMGTVIVNKEQLEAAKEVLKDFNSQEE